ncbi:MAG: bifunctional (p)ppGpp synthetase/guanosine-3',5'-bis(diphosphate) 3'-pyrophosphohydrolase [Candidatus Woesearchaeota archaeon]
MNINDIIKKVKYYLPESDTSQIKKAYEIAREVHKNEKRASGEPFINHPLEVANLVADFKMDVESVCAALLHDVVETDKTMLEKIKKEFGEDVAILVDGMTKITELKSKGRDIYQAESIRKMLMATAKDIRVIIIKLLDKLHNMRTLDYLPEEKQRRISQEVMDVYAPLAYRLGIEKVKEELENLAFKYLEPQKYAEIEAKVKKSVKFREQEIEKIRNILEQKLKEQNIECRVLGRIKTIYSIYRKMQRKNRSFEEIFDVAALRVIVSDVETCYKVLGIIHNLWTPIPRRFKDYIAMPKINFYRALHDVVIGPEGTIVEVQIRTEEMEEVAEDGIAAHWKYKGIITDEEFDKKLSWLKQIMEWQQEAGTAKEFIESLEIDFFKDEIYTFTPKGKIIELPKGATPLDFAYAVHSELGDHCIGAKVNGTFVSLRTELRTGDVVEILTSKNQKPVLGWLNIVKTSKARNKIRKYIEKTRNISITKKRPVEREEQQKEKASIIIAKGIKNPSFKLAKCCLPNPGEHIIGFAAKTGMITVHKKECEKIKEEKIAKTKVKVEWRNDYSDLIELRVEAIDRVGLLADILNTIATTGTNLQNANAKMLGKGMAECKFKVKIYDLEHVKDIIQRINRLQGIKKIYVGSLGV